jgi:hypothetical protein
MPLCSHLLTAFCVTPKRSAALTWVWVRTHSVKSSMEADTSTESPFPQVPQVPGLAAMLSPVAKHDSGTFWTRLSEAMTDKKIKVTQTSAAALIGLTQGSAKKWKQGGFPSQENANDLAIRLGVSVEWLLNGRGPKAPLSSLTTDEELLLHLYRQLQPAEQGEVRTWMSVQISMRDRQSRTQDILSDFPRKSAKIKK